MYILVLRSLVSMVLHDTSQLLHCAGAGVDPYVHTVHSVMICCSVVGQHVSH